MNGKHAIYRVYQALCAGMLRLFPAGRQLIKCQFDKQHDLFIVKIFEKGGVFIAQFTD